MDTTKRNGNERNKPFHKAINYPDSLIQPANDNLKQYILALETANDNYLPKDEQHVPEAKK